MLKPEEEEFFIIPSVFGARINSSNRKTFFQIAETSAIWDRLTRVGRNYQRHLLHTTVTFFPRSKEIYAPTCFFGFSALKV